MIEKIKKKIFSRLKQNNIDLRFSEEFVKELKKVKDNNTKIKLYKQILRIVENPDVGKPMRYSRKGEQKVYLDSFRLYYKFYPDENVLRIVEFSHKDAQ